MNAPAKLSRAKAARVKALAEALADAARKYDAETQVGMATVPWLAAHRAREDARAALIRECETPDAEGGAA